MQHPCASLPCRFNSADIKYVDAYRSIMAALNPLSRASLSDYRIFRHTCFKLPACTPATIHVRPFSGNAALQQFRLLDVSYDRLRDMIVSLGKPSYKADQLWRSVLHEGAKDATAISTWGKSERVELHQMLALRHGSVETESVSSDGTVKWLVGLHDKSAKQPLADAGFIEDATGTSCSVGKQTSATAAPPDHDALATPRFTVESVYIPDGKRGTLCVSSQAGCSLACSFCHTGTQALSGNLKQGDIVEQVLTARERVLALASNSESSSSSSSGGATPKLSSVKPHARFPRISHIVFMGQGEPLLNWRSVSGAISLLTHPKGLAMAPRRITVSTSGIAPVIPRIAQDTPGVRLAISLHAPNDKLRGEIMAVNKQWGISEVLDACQQYIDIRLKARAESRTLAAAGDDGDADTSDSDDDAQPLQSSRHDKKTSRSRPNYSSNYTFNGSSRIRITFEYVMLRGTNDSPALAHQLVHLLTTKLAHAQLHAHVNLIPFNPWPGSTYQCSEPGVILEFQNIIERAGIRATIRKSRGQDILGACGQLRSSASLKQRRS